MRDRALSKLLVLIPEGIDERLHREFLLRIMTTQDLCGVKGQFPVCRGKAIRECRDDDLVERTFCVEADKSVECSEAIRTRLIRKDINDERQSVATYLGQSGHAIIGQRRLSGQQIC